mmetsp:Transcript_134156/g.304224  ORF Transcript_134156/g.304224 Transcript_134156/m.304224 type:complete len:644 (-) Transcript_134156:288-2219(-)
MIIYDNSVPVYRILGTFYAYPSVFYWSCFGLVVGGLLSYRRFVVLDAPPESFEWFSIHHASGFSMFATILGWCIAQRTGMAMARYDEGTASVLQMAAKWSCALNLLNGYVNSVLSAREPADEEAAALLRFRTRAAHWFSCLSALAFQSLQCQEEEEDEDPFEFLMSYNFVNHARKTKCVRTRRTSTTLRASELEEEILSKSMETVNFLTKPGHISQLRSQPTMHVIGTLTYQERLQLEPLCPEDRVFRVSAWLVELVIMEHQAGRLMTHAAVLSRVFQELSDGMLGYNQACKIAFIPFPFPYAQLMTLVITLWVLICPIVVDVFARSWVVTPFVSVLVAFSYVGLNHIAIDLEMPFGLGMNHLPLSQMHEQFVDFVADVMLQPPFNKDLQDSFKQIDSAMRPLWRRDLGLFTNTALEDGYFPNSHNADAELRRSVAPVGAPGAVASATAYDRRGSMKRTSTFVGRTSTLNILQFLTVPRPAKRNTTVASFSVEKTLASTPPCTPDAPTPDPHTPDSSRSLVAPLVIESSQPVMGGGADDAGGAQLPGSVLEIRHNSHLSAGSMSPGRLSALLAPGPSLVPQHKRGTTVALPRNVVLEPPRPIVPQEAGEAGAGKLRERRAPCRVQLKGAHGQQRSFTMWARKP